MMTPGFRKPIDLKVLEDNINEISQKEIEDLMDSLKTSDKCWYGEMRSRILFWNECLQAVDEILEKKYGCERKKSVG